MNKQPIDFARLIEQVEQSQVGPAELALWGGQGGAGDILALLQGWSALAGMPYRIWEYAYKIEFEQSTALPAEINWLERAQLFGQGGDLSLRRDGALFRWRFVGPAGTQPPGPAQDFWQSGEPAARYYQHEETVLLWGERRPGFSLWFEDRVGRARLSYPLGQDGRVQLKYRSYSRAGRVEFIWLLGLEAYHG